MLFNPSVRPLLKAGTAARRSYIEIFKYVRFRSSTCSNPIRSGHLCFRKQKPQYPLSQRRCLSQLNNSGDSDDARSVAAFIKSIDFPAATTEVGHLSKAQIGQEVVLHGYVGQVFNKSKALSFVWLHSKGAKHCVQIVSTHAKDEDILDTSAHAQLRSCTQHTPVALRGVVAKKSPSKDEYLDGSRRIQDVEIQLREIILLNKFPSDVMMTVDTKFGPEQRHLQLRKSQELRFALAFRDHASSVCRDVLHNNGFLEIETPLLFKSTPEGAREFLVPTREKGMAYALPQSPQQYKQILMASGFPKYFQFARCFRDEDLRADRQPEFTQLDLEMSFAKGEQVIEVIEKLLVALWESAKKEKPIAPFSRISYNEAMAKYGSDKPDLRLGMEIHTIGELLPADLVSKIGPLALPAVDVMKLSISENPSDTRKFVNEFMSSPEAAPFLVNPDGQPGIFIYDSKQPLYGLQPFGFQTAEYLEDILKLSDGDLVVLQARKDEPFSGGSTPIGRLRLALHKAAVSKELIPAPTGFKFLWVIDFPLFSPSTESEPGQGGAAGFSSTHHPFTSPKTVKDIELLSTDPLKVVGEHYDIVVNGVELGGGSRRIHSAALQEYVLRKILKMSEERLADFKHLIDVLRAGCPPHAGIALGFDRLIAVMLEKESVRDVIAFPKSGSGEDPLVQSPNRLTADQLKTYHLKLDE